MPRVVHVQNNFTGGELSPRMLGRGDVARYQNGAEILENVFVVVHGGAVRRFGLRYLATEQFEGARRARVMRYVFNVEQSFCLLFGHNYARVFDGSTGAVILNSGLTPLEIATPYSDDEVWQLTTCQSGDTLLLFHPNYATRQLRRLSADQWLLTEVPWVVQPFAELGHLPEARLTLSAATVGSGRTFTTAPTSVPGAPVIGAAFPLNAAASVNFTPPADAGGLAITSYTATSAPGGFTATGSSSPLRVTGLTNGVAYTFTVTATNPVGTGAASAASAAVVPNAGLSSGALTVTADSLNLEVIVENGRATGILGPTASAAGAIGPVSYSWTRISGSTAVTITRANTAQPELSSTNFGATNYVTLRCNAVDGTGATGLVDVNVAVRHRAIGGGGGGGGYVP